MVRAATSSRSKGKQIYMDLVEIAVPCTVICYCLNPISTPAQTLLPSSSIKRVSKLFENNGATFLQLYEKKSFDPVFI